jgi:DNA-binding transcriptional regulator YhcF (GntR family)
MQDNAELRMSARMNQGSKNHLSYKFQRLREQIRASVLSGEFGDRLPGERELGRKYRANAKTINKALCDLSSEGLLVRQIGRGTFLAQSDHESNGRSASRKSVCLLQVETERTPQYRIMVVKVVRELLAQKGLVLETTSILLPPGRADVPLQAWPPTSRASTAALISYPDDPLSFGAGRLGDDCVAEAYRRHVPLLSMGGYAGTAKIDVVVPDYLDGGFRLAEHLTLLGCREIAVLVSEAGGREAELAVSGCRTAAARYRCSLVRAVLPCSSEDREDLGSIGAFALSESTKGGSSCPTGLVCIGRECLRAVVDQRLPSGMRLSRGTAIVCLLEPGDATAQDLNLTAYEVNPERIGVWGAELIAKARPGRVPVEVIIPGGLRIRGTAALESADSVAAEPTKASNVLPAGGGVAEVSI